MFGHPLRARSFDSLEGILARKQTFLPITLGGIGFIPTSTIIPITYLGSWAFVASIIVTMFMVDQRPFFFEILAQINNNIFPFQQHLKATYDLLLPLA